MIPEWRFNCYNVLSVAVAKWPIQCEFATVSFQLNCVIVWRLLSTCFFCCWNVFFEMSFVLKVLLIVGKSHETCNLIVIIFIFYHLHPRRWVDGYVRNLWPTKFLVWIKLVAFEFIDKWKLHWYFLWHNAGWKQSRRLVIAVKCKLDLESILVWIDISGVAIERFYEHTDQEFRQFTGNLTHLIAFFSARQLCWKKCKSYLSKCFFLSLTSEISASHQLIVCSESNSFEG